MPTRLMADFGCELAVSGQAAAIPPKTVMNSRRRISGPVLDAPNTSVVNFLAQVQAIGMSGPGQKRCFGLRPITSLSGRHHSITRPRHLISSALMVGAQGIEP